MGDIKQVQVNVRVPAAAHDILLKIGARLRDDADFLGLLEQWLGEQAEPSIATLLSQRLALVEQRLAALEAGGSAAREPDNTSSRPSLLGEPTRWTIGKGRGHRLTVDGEAELERRINAGESDSVIAAALGVKPGTVGNRRKRIEEHSGQG